jgi:hypothetical protein
MRQDAIPTCSAVSGSAEQSIEHRRAEFRTSKLRVFCYSQFLDRFSNMLDSRLHYTTAEISRQRNCYSARTPITAACQPQPQPCRASSKRRTRPRTRLSGSVDRSMITAGVSRNCDAFCISRRSQHQHASYEVLQSISRSALPRTLVN